MELASKPLEELTKDSIYAPIVFRIISYLSVLPKYYLATCRDHSKF